MADTDGQSSGKKIRWLSRFAKEVQATVENETGFISHYDGSNKLKCTYKDLGYRLDEPYILDSSASSN